MSMINQFLHLVRGINIDPLSIEGDGIKPFSVDPNSKLTTTWGKIKTNS